MRIDFHCNDLKNVNMNHKLHNYYKRNRKEKDMISIEILLEDKEMVNKLVRENNSIQCLVGHKFQGDPEMIQLLIDLSKVAIPAVAGVVVAFINSKKHIVIKHKGIELKGISEKNALEILEKLHEKDRNEERTKRKG